MIDPKMFNLEKLVKGMFWFEDYLRLYEIIPDYMPPFPQSDTRPGCVVRHIPTGRFLRYSKGPRQGHFWDVYGDDYMSPELALLALYKAPAPPVFPVMEIEPMRLPAIARINPNSKRAENWRKVFGGLEVPIVDALPVLAELPGGAEWVYLIDLQKISPDQRERLIAHIAQRFQIPANEVAASLDTEGCPILVDDVWVQGTF